MTTPATGPLKFSDINTELGLGSTTQISMSAALTRTLAQVASGAIRFSDLRGKTYRSSITYTVTAATGGAATLNYITGAATNLNVVTTGAYIAGFTDIIVVVNAGVTIYSNDVATPALTLFLTEGYSLYEQDTLVFVNNGNIIGKGGNAGTWPAPPYTTTPAHIFPQVGGDALIINGYPLVSGNGHISVTGITNTGNILAGGGGAATVKHTGGGGGAGGGNGGAGLLFNTPSDFKYAAGGAGGTINSAGSNGTAATSLAAGGGGGGRNLTTLTGAAAVTDLWSGFSVATPGLGGNAGGSGAAFVTDVDRAASGGGGGWGGTGGYSGFAGGNGVYTLTSGAGGSNGSAGGNGLTPTLYGATGGSAIIADTLSDLADITNTGIIYGVGYFS